MLNKDTQILLLQNYPMLAELSSSQLDDFFANATLLHVPKGAVIFDENQLCQGYPLLLTGNIRVVKAALNGRELVLYRVFCGETCILTSGSLLGDGVYHARGVTEQEVTLAIIQPAAFRRLIANCQPFRDAVFNLFAERLTELMHLVSAVAFQKLDQRLATLLLSKPHPIQITHQALADELGSVRELVSRQLESFAEQGWITLGRGQINVIDALALKNLLG